MTYEELLYELKDVMPNEQSEDFYNNPGVQNKDCYNTPESKDCNNTPGYISKDCSPSLPALATITSDYYRQGTKKNLILIHDQIFSFVSK